MLMDSFGRIHDYLRISLTDVCNLRCNYCMPDDDYHFMPSDKLMKADEIFQLASVFVSLGIKKIRLTGGEPLVRKDAGEIIEKLASLPVALTITTNGTRLHEHLDKLIKANIQSINISLDTLDRNRFHLLTKRDSFEQVRDNIDLLLSNNIHPKINMVVMKGVNEHEIMNFVEWTQHHPVHVRFIEFMPFSGNHWQREQVFTWQDILKQIETKYRFTPLTKRPHDTAKHYQIDGFNGTFAVISTMSAPFCGDCNRIRLTADGKIKNCLFSATETDILSPFRKGEDIISIVRQNISAKAKELGGQFTSDLEKVEASHIQNRSMISIGG